MRNVILSLLVLVSLSRGLHAADDLPIVPEGFVVDVVAAEPMVSNPCVMAFDKRGRICVAQGPQWRAPTPETPGDRIDILIDEDGDGAADDIKTFAEGFNSVQGIAWHGDDLWIANAPDLTVVRDTDGDDEADVYIKVYTGLGNLEHSLHGLNFGPDGKLYMSKGNSKGYNRLDQLAPKTFRKLWGLASPEGAPEYTDVEVFSKETYKRAYHTPQDDWGQQGGILRCDPYGESVNTMGRDLEIFARGFRNPWDICFDDGFEWLGTDNDQTEGDKVFAPFYGAHFGWGHPWSFDWKGIDHLPTVPISVPLYEGSGAGLIHYGATQFPTKYQGVFFVNDWMRREVYLFRPEWDGAFLRHEGGGFPSVFAHAGGGRSLPASSGRVFEPTDIEVGPEGAIYILSWGHGYGGTIENGKQIDAGRVYRIRYGNHAPQALPRPRVLSEMTSEQLFADLGSSVPAWRVDAQNELLRRGAESIPFLKSRLQRESSKAQQTWGLWTLGRLSTEALLDAYAKQKSDLNVHLQSLRILAQENPAALDGLLAWNSKNARLRHATVQAVWRGGRDDLSNELIRLAADETDRVVFYSAWNALQDLLSTDELKVRLTDSRPRVRLAALLALLFEDALSVDQVLPLRTDKAPQVAAMVELWLEKTGNGAPLITLSPPPGDYSEPIAVTAQSSIPRSVITYTTDGSVPAMTGPRATGPIAVESDTRLRFSVFQDYTQAGAMTDAEYRIRPTKAYRHRPFIDGLVSDSGRRYEFDWSGLAVGKRHYTDRDYRILEVSGELAGLPFLRTANEDDRRIVERLVSFRSDSDVSVLVGVDARNREPLSWMNIGQPDGFQNTGLQIITSDPVFNVYEKKFPAGQISLGANVNRPNDSGRGNYIVLFKREILSQQSDREPITMEAAVAAMADADPERGRELFLHPQGAGCFKCHQMQGIGQVLGPDLSDIGNRAKTPEVLIESIIHPSEVITEGFAQQKVLTVDGRVVAGSVLEETGRLIKLAASDGSVTTVNKDDIEQRVGTKISPMPDGFAKMMTAQQVADLTAWLMAQKTVGYRDGFWFQDNGDSLNIHFAGQQVATYLKDHPKLTRRALVNVTTPGGIRVTRNYPPRKPDDIDPGYGAEDGIIHPHMHPGIWLGFGDVDGNDYWRLQSRVAFDRFIQPPSGDRNSGYFVTRNLLLRKDATKETRRNSERDSLSTVETSGYQDDEVVCVETTRYHFENVPEGLLLRLDAEYRSDDHDFYFGDQEESGLAVRVASPIRVQGGNGTILNDRGERNGAQVWGKQAKWFDYFGTVGDREVGILVVPSPDNPRPSWLHARDYGVIVTNPFPKQPKERREPYVKTWVKRGECYNLSYAILIHDLPADKPIDRDHVAESLLKSFD
ncbi:Cytochrome c [Stieleria maiorica]|uniref:Cytochrome c n=1 Tax=Stieleria maiorica TaxID=2795974 RepID=A0A5B9MFP7_9BACT|nr:PVC-type heme-binding CxxCH protein [Stieleria maiorica]QEF98926.1 Cytochrome c [Stieleria maiorica]